MKFLLETFEEDFSWRVLREVFEGNFCRRLEGDICRRVLREVLAGAF